MFEPMSNYLEKEPPQSKVSHDKGKLLSHSSPEATSPQPSPHNAHQSANQANTSPHLPSQSKKELPPTPFGERVEFNPQNQVATVFAKKFPTKKMRDAYAHLADSFEHNPPTLTRQGIPYRLQFNSE